MKLAIIFSSFLLPFFSLRRPFLRFFSFSPPFLL